MPYYLAPLWDAKYAELEKERKAKQAKAKAKKSKASKANADAGIPKELKQQVKRSKAAQGLLQDLDTQVKGLARKWEKQKEEILSDTETDSEDDDVVFVGRNGQMQDMKSPSKNQDYEALILQDEVDDHGSKFA